MESRFQEIVRDLRGQSVCINQLLNACLGRKGVEPLARKPTRDRGAMLPVKIFPLTAAKSCAVDQEKSRRIFVTVCPLLVKTVLCQKRPLPADQAVHSPIEAEPKCLDATQRC